VNQYGQIIASQDAVLKILFPIVPSHCVLTGGTALTRFHGFSHRFSEDLDLFLFSPYKDLILLWIVEMRRHAFYVEVVSGSSDRPDELFHLIALISPPSANQPIRVDFVEDIFSGCWLPQRMKTHDTRVEFNVDPLEAILHKKLYAVYSNRLRHAAPRTKDILDIFILLRDTFRLEVVREFYRDARDISLPFNAIVEMIKEAPLDFEGLLGVSREIEREVSLWRAQLKG